MCTNLISKFVPGVIALAFMFSASFYITRAASGPSHMDQAAIPARSTGNVYALAIGLAAPGCNQKLEINGLADCSASNAYWDSACTPRPTIDDPSGVQFSDNLPLRSVPIGGVSAPCWAETN